jgi:alpha-D-xyloside xylohydrolase
MRFTEGRWRTREGINHNWMGHCERLSIDEAASTVELSLIQPQHSRGNQLNTGTLTANLSTPIEGITALNLTHWAGEHSNGPDFEFDLPSTPPKATIAHKPKESLSYTTGPLNLNVNTSPNKLDFTYTSNGKHLTAHSFRSLAFVTSSNHSAYNPEHGQFATRKNHILTSLDLSVHEKLYGLGERFGAFVKNGQSIDIFADDGGSSSELAYKNIPFYVSSRGYGVFFNTPGKVMLELQSERTTRVNAVVEGESVEVMVIAGPKLKNVLERYTRLTGRPGLPPAWSYGLWLSTSFTTSYDEKTVTSFLDGFKDRDIPLGVFHFDCFWMKGLQWCDFTFDEDMFPNPKAYLSRLKERGIKVCVWINPYIGQASPLFKQGKEKGYFIMRADTQRDTVWQWDMWQPGMAIVDFTNPAAVSWYQSHLERLVDLGVDAFKTDFGEVIPYLPQQVKYHSGQDPQKLHNFYSYLYNKSVYATLKRKGKEACLFARSATTGGQRFPVHWGGDCESTFVAMAETLRGGLSLGLSGFGFWAHDIGGFEGYPPPAVYKRWVQFGLLSSHSRLHGSGSYRVPWIYGGEEGEECSKVLREMTKLKIGLTPYLLRAGLEANQIGLPVLRAMILEFEDDLNTHGLDTQYMLGSELMVAPVFDEKEVSFYVPRTEEGGVWRSWFDHKKTYEGGKWYVEEHGFDTLPVLVRPGGVVPFNSKMQTPGSDVMDGLELRVNGLTEGREIGIVEAKDVGKVAKTVKISPGLKVEGVEGVNVVDMAK